MRILIPILGFAPQGGYRVLSELANAWIRLGHESAFLVPSTSGQPYFPTNANIVYTSRNGITDAPDTSRHQSGANNLMSLFTGLREIGRDYDVILANHSLTAWPVRWTQTGEAKKFYYIQAYEPGYYSLLKHPIKRFLSSLSYYLNLRQISNSRTYQAPGIDPLEVIPPGIDLSIFHLKENPGQFASDNEIILGTIGRTEPYKGTATALAAYRTLREKDPRLRMHVGFGNISSSPDVDVVDIHNDKELAAFYRSVDVLVVSCSGQHGAPHYPVIEAMASGTPVVHTGYFPGNHLNSWEAKDPSVDAVTTAIQACITSSDSSKISRTQIARDTVAEKLGWDAVATRFLVNFDA